MKINNNSYYFQIQTNNKLKSILIEIYKILSIVEFIEENLTYSNFR